MILKISFCIFLFALSFQSCSDKEKDNPKKSEEDSQESPQDTNLTHEERFASMIMSDFLIESEDEDLAQYLEEELFRMGQSYRGAAIIEITPSTWLISLEKNGSLKNFILQKYIDFETLEYYFAVNETSLNPSEILSKK